MRIDVRSAAVSAVIALAGAALLIVTLWMGDVSIAFPDVLAVLAGHGTPKAQLVVGEWRLPRALIALALGAALALSGAVFQSLTRNPLGSPDIIGFSTGAYTGGLVVILALGGSYFLTAAGAVVGGLVTAVVVYGLSRSRGTVQSFRLIIVGIGVSATLASVNTWLITRADVDDAMAASVWGSGSLGGLGMTQLVPVLAILAVVVPVLFTYGPGLRMLEVGDDLARAAGTRVERVRLGAMLWAIVLVAVATAAAGPIAFIALVAPQISRRLVGTASIAFTPAALTGAFLLLLSDLLAQRVFAPTQLPVGVMTVTLGGVYFVWLLVRESTGYGRR